jgi:hypothetical protein
MNVYTGLLFLQGHIADPGLFIEPVHFGPTFGNKVANARAARERWEEGDPLVLEDDPVPAGPGAEAA